MSRVLVICFIGGCSVISFMMLGCQTTSHSERKPEIIYPENSKSFDTPAPAPIPMSKAENLQPEIEPVATKTSTVSVTDKSTMHEPTNPPQPPQHQVQTQIIETPSTIAKVEVTVKSHEPIDMVKCETSPSSDAKNRLQPIEEATEVNKKEKTTTVIEVAKDGPLMKGEESDNNEPETKKVKKFYLRIISLPLHDYYHKKASSIAEYLKKKEGIKDVVARKSHNKNTEFWVVDIGNFNSPKTADAKELQNKIRNLKYEGSRQFQDAYFLSY